MADTVKIPGMGEVSKKEATIFGVILVAVIAVAYYRHTKNAAASTATTTAAPVVDSATGYPTGSAEDLAALAAQNGTYNYSGYGAGGGGSNVQGGGAPSTGTGFVSNSQWAQAAEDYLVNTVYQGDTTQSANVAAAIGKYLTGQPLTTDMVSIVEQAIAFQGMPPIAGTDGFPPSFHTQAPSAGVGGGNPPIGQQGNGGIPATGPWNLSARIIGPTEVDLNWTQQGNITRYQVNYGVNGNVNMFKYQVTGTAAKIGALKPGTPYIFSVSAINTNGTLSPPSAQVTVTPR